MAEFATLISSLPLYQELRHSTGRDSIDATDIAKFEGLVAQVADYVGPLLARIPVTFRQYTEHDIRHSRNIIARMGDIIPRETLKQLNGLEITLLLLSALLHDAGMIVSDSEKSETLLSDGFRRFRDTSHGDRSKAIADAKGEGNEPRATAIEDALLAEYYRRLHPERVWRFLEDHLEGKLLYREVDFSEHLARLCESHAWGVEESNDPRNPQKAVSRLDDNVRIYGVRANIQYLACCLRLADIMDFDRSRTPLAVFQHVNFTEDKSWEEWNKHLQVQGWEITPTQVAFDIPCTHPAFYVAVHEFLGWIDEELRQCRDLVENKPQATAERYKLFLPQLTDRRKVRMRDPSYIAGAFRFQLDYENILQLLMDKSLYPDPSLFLRELLQNALDACRRREAVMKERGLESIYEPRIVAWDYSSDTNNPRIIFQDNGVGMSQRIVEQYFLRIGRSYYRSPEFDLERERLRESGIEVDSCSQFGIGILSCFMVTDRFEVETYQEGNDPLHITIEGPAKYFVIRRHPRPSQDLLFKKEEPDTPDRPLERPGTRVTVSFRANAGFDAQKVLQKFGINMDYPLTIYKDGERRIIGARAWEQERTILQIVRPGNNSAFLTNIEEILMPVFIRFDKYEFARHLHGKAWFWMFRDSRDKPSPHSGFLSISDSAIKADALYDYIGKIQYILERSRRTIKTDLESIRLTSAGIDYDEGLGNITSWFLPPLTDDEKSILKDAMNDERLPLWRPSIQWNESVEAIKSLADKSRRWAELPVRFGEHIRVEVIEKIALHSILVPSGVVRWSPSTVRSEVISFMPLVGGMQVDIRGPNSPIPAAHRLFIPEERAGDFKYCFSRACLEHALELSEGHLEESQWRSWIAPLFYKPLEQDMMQYYAKFKIAIIDAHGIRSYVEPRQLLEIFGRQIPVSLWGESTPGISRLDPISISYLEAMGYDMKMGALP